MISNCVKGSDGAGFQGSLVLLGLMYLSEGHSEAHRGRQHCDSSVRHVNSMIAILH